MGYIPVARDAGRIMYESTINRADILANTLTGLSEKMYQRDQENKAFGAKLKSLESLLQTHKDKFGMSEEQVKQFLSQDPNQSPKERYLRIGSFVEDSIKMSQLEKEKLAMKESQARAALLAAQEKDLKTKTQLTEDDIKFFQEMEALALTEQRGAGGGQPATGGAAPTTPRVAPEGLGQFVGGTSGMEQPAVAAPAAPRSAAAAAPATAVARPSATVTATDIFQAKQAAGPGASRAQVMMMARSNAAARAKEAPREGLYETQSLAQQDAQRLDAESPIPGYIRTATYDPQAKAFVMKLVERKKTAAEDLESTTAGKLAEMEATQASKKLEAIRDQATNARDDLTRLDRIENAVLSGVRTGFGSDFVTGLTSALVEIGMYPSGKQASKEVLQSDVAKDALTKTKQYMSGQGSVSNAERERVDRVAQNANMQGDALLELVRIQRSVYNRQIAADEHRMALEDKYEKDPLRTLKINKEMDRWWAKNTIGKFEDELKKEQGSTAAATKAGTTEWNYDPKTGQYNPTSKP
jgi:hypothetical protein